MIINTLNIVLEATDLQRMIANFAGKIDKVKEFSVSLENGVVVLSGKIALGFAIPFSTKWKVRPANDGYALCLTLSGVSVGMVGMGEEMISGQVLSLLKDKLNGYDAVSVVDKDIKVDLKKTLSARGITLNAPIQSVDITSDDIELKV